VIIRKQGRAGAGASAVMHNRGFGFAEPAQLSLSRTVSMDGSQLVSVAGELDVATAQLAYDYLSDVIDHGHSPVNVDLAELTFCDASGLGVLARIASRAREAGRQLMLTSARPSLLKIIRITGLDGLFPELCSPAVTLVT
jgi:anti-sigma B factor antagonist